MINRIATISTVNLGLTSRIGAFQDQAVVQDVFSPTLGMRATPEWRQPSWIAYMSDGGGPEVSKSDDISPMARRLFKELMHQGFDDVQVTDTAAELIGAVSGKMKGASTSEQPRKIKRRASWTAAKSIYKELIRRQYNEKQIVSVAADFVSAVADKKAQLRQAQEKIDSPE